MVVVIVAVPAPTAVSPLAFDCGDARVVTCQGSILVCGVSRRYRLCQLLCGLPPKVMVAMAGDMLIPVTGTPPVISLTDTLSIQTSFTAVLDKKKAIEKDDSPLTPLVATRERVGTEALSCRRKARRCVPDNPALRSPFF